MNSPNVPGPGATVDLTNCDREPIHVPGSIQVHGCLLACDVELRQVRRHSQNAAELLGVDPAEINGRKLEEIVGDRAAHDLRNALARTSDPSRPAQLIGLRCGPDNRGFDVAVHQYRGVAIVEFEPAHQSSRDALELTRNLIVRLRRLADAENLLSQSARLLRALLEYDRVMIYRFAEDGSGSVIREAKRADLESFLGQHFPASDIPRQARELYLRNTIRVIGDARGGSAPIVPPLDLSGEPLDLSYAHLRSVSPIHLEYLRNMGVAASMSISIIVGGRLWGLIACHHYSPRHLSMAQRIAAELFGEFFSLQLEALRHKQRLENATAARRLLDRLLRDILARDNFQEFLTESLPDLAGLLPCDGVALWLDGRWTEFGSVPPRHAIPALTRLISKVGDRGIWATHELPAHIEEAKEWCDRACGVLAIPLTQIPRDYLLLFRREVVQTIKWGGDPAKTYDTGPMGDRLTPRKSFAIWKEEVAGRSLPWTEADRETAEATRVALLEIILRQSELLAEERRKAGLRQKILNEELNHRVKNILALIKSLVSQPVEDGAGLDAYVEALKRRLMALSFAHDQIVRGDGGGALQALLEAELSPYRDAGIDLDGPAVSFNAQAFSVMTLVVHELATNAAKYGALSRPEGRVSVTWSLNEAGDCDIRWQESKGPLVTAPRRQGFGSVLIERSIPYDLGGAVDVDYRPDGLTARFTVPARFVSVRGGQPEETPVPQPQNDEAAIQGLRIMIVEDQFVIAMDVETMLADRGAGDIATCGNITEATRILETFRPDAAVLDVNLSNGTSIPVAEELERRRIPFVFATGYGDSIMIPEAFSKVPVVRKPYEAEALVSALGQVLQQRQ